jgi:hypothetical protein
MDPQDAALEPSSEQEEQSVSENIARFLEEHELHAAQRRNMHIHEPEAEPQED